MEFVRVPCSLFPPTLCSICSLYSFSLSFPFSLLFSFPLLFSLFLFFSPLLGEIARMSRTARERNFKRAREVHLLFPSHWHASYTCVGHTKAIVYFGLFYIICRVHRVWSRRVIGVWADKCVLQGIVKFDCRIACTIVRITFYVLFRLLLMIKV